MDANGTANETAHQAADTTALLEVSDVRVDEHGVPCLDGLSFASKGRTIAVLGAPRALFELASGTRAPLRGSVRIAGESAVAALGRGAIAGAPLEPPLPPTWTPRRYVAWSARLAGAPSSEARERAAGALAALQLQAYADARLGSVSGAARRATVIAAALATGAGIVVLEDPLRGWRRARSGLGHILTRALADRSWILFAGRLPLDAPLALETEWAARVVGSRVVGAAPPAELAVQEGVYAVRVAGDMASFVAQARAGGATIAGEPRGDELTVDLGRDRKTQDLLRWADEGDAVILELRPLATAFT